MPASPSFDPPSAPAPPTCHAGDGAGASPTAPIKRDLPPGAPDIPAPLDDAYFTGVATICKTLVDADYGLRLIVTAHAGAEALGHIAGPSSGPPADYLDAVTSYGKTLKEAYRELLHILSPALRPPGWDSAEYPTVGSPPRSPVRPAPQTTPLSNDVSAIFPSTASTPSVEPRHARESHLARESAGSPADHSLTESSIGDSLNSSAAHECPGEAQAFVHAKAVAGEPRRARESHPARESAGSPADHSLTESSIGGSLNSSAVPDCPEEVQAFVHAKAARLRQLSHGSPRPAAGRTASPDQDDSALQATAGFLASSHHEVERQARVSGLRSVALIGPIPDPPRAFDPSDLGWPASALAVHDALRLHIEALEQGREAEKLLFQRELNAARLQAAADAAESLNTLRLRLDQRTDDFLSACQEMDHLRHRSAKRLHTALGPRPSADLDHVFVIHTMEQDQARLLHHARLLYNGCMTRDADIVRLKALAIAALRHALRLETDNPAAEPSFAGDPRAYGVGPATIRDLATELLSADPPSALSITSAEDFLRANYEDRQYIPSLEVEGVYIPSVPGPRGPPGAGIRQPAPFEYKGPHPPAPSPDPALHQQRQACLDRFLASIPSQYSFPLMYNPLDPAPPPRLLKRSASQAFYVPRSPVLTPERSLP